MADQTIPEALAARLEELARVSVLLVASDFDGTLSPIAPEPGLARPNREAVAALHALAVMQQTSAAVISGRALGDLAERTGLASDVFLVGSHGSEFDPGFAHAIPAEAVHLRERIREEVETLVAGEPGFLIEHKPASIALHYRKADPARAQRVAEAVREGPGRLAGVYLKPGKQVLELSVVATDKGRALETIRQRVGASATLFMGDDEGDEVVFKLLRGPDVGVKIGPEATAAEFRVADTDAAARILATLVELREAWVRGVGAEPIEHHAMLSDQRTVALVTPKARVVWCCLPRIDSPAIFAELLGGPSAGYFSIGPAGGGAPLGQEYDGATMTLRTRWPSLTVSDLLDCSGGRATQRAGRTDLVRKIEGTGRVAIDFAPRLDFGRLPTRLSLVTDGVRIEGSADPIVLRSPGVSWDLVADGPHTRARGELDLGTSGSPVYLELRYGVAAAAPLVVSNERRVEQTNRFWSSWAEQLVLPELHRELVLRSALALRALVYGPTGAISAAGTTSLPEHLGGVRNWDYRYCWLRDAALSATALARLGAADVGMRLVDWLMGVLDSEGSADRFRPLYTVTGGQLGPEGEIRELAGYRGSRPVRVSNAAAQQLQLDVFGPIVDLLLVLAQTGVAVSAEHARLVEAIVSAVAHRWREPDHGIWEVRVQQQHFVHSKVMCWVAVDRGLQFSHLHQGEQRADWAGLREEIAADVLEHGWNRALGSYTATYGDAVVDAACLHIGLSGLLGADDPRFRTTVDVVERVLRRGPTVYRYLYEDGLPGREGGFHLCTAWLIESLAMVGERGRARALLDEFAATFGPTGLAPEEYDPRTQTSLGNHPQAYTHLGLIQAVLAIEARGVAR